MTDMTNYLEEALIKNILENTNFSALSNTYVALFTADPTESGDQTNEVSDSGYSRVSTSPSDWQTTGTNGQRSNSTKFTFGKIQDGSVTVSHMAILDASTGGNMLVYGPIEDANGNAKSRTLEIGDLLNFETSDLKVTLK